MKDIKDRSQANEEEKEYITSAIAIMEANLRSLDTVYKGRELNFNENEELRRAYIDSVTEAIDFGKRAQDFMRSLPIMTIGTAGGVTIAQTLGLSGVKLWGIGLLLAAAGYLVNIGFVRFGRRLKQNLYVTQDYERDLYYDQYISRVSTILTSLYLDLDRVHKKVFGQTYPVDGPQTSYNIVEKLLKGARPTFCKYIHKHKREKKITPELWPVCESGVSDAIRSCPYWEDETE